MRRTERIRQAWDDLMESREVKFLKAELAQVRHERDVLAAKVERMELAIMPLTSTAGAAYARRMEAPSLDLEKMYNYNTTKEPQEPAYERNWSQVQAEFEKYQMEEVNVDGVRRETGTTETPDAAEVTDDEPVRRAAAGL